MLASHFVYVHRTNLCRWHLIDHVCVSQYTIFMYTHTYTIFIVLNVVYGNNNTAWEINEPLQVSYHAIWHPVIAIRSPFGDIRPVRWGNWTWLPTKRICFVRRAVLWNVALHQDICKRNYVSGLFSFPRWQFNYTYFTDREKSPGLDSLMRIKKAPSCLFDSSFSASARVMRP